MKQHFTQTEERKAKHGGQNLVGKIKTLTAGKCKNSTGRTNKYHTTQI
jgi:hypothetical protein